MKNGAGIIGNSAQQDGGGVLVLGEFAMDGGEVSHNISTGNVSGGAVHVDPQGTMTMNGGKIAWNKAL